MTKVEFKLAFINYCFEEGISFDPYDISAAWRRYQTDPTKFEHLKPYMEK